MPFPSHCIKSTYHQHSFSLLILTLITWGSVYQVSLWQSYSFLLSLSILSSLAEAGVMFHLLKSIYINYLELFSIGDQIIMSHLFNHSYQCWWIDVYVILWFIIQYYFVQIVTALLVSFCFPLKSPYHFLSILKLSVITRCSGIRWRASQPDFCNIEPALHTWNQSLLIVVYSYF